MKTIRRFFSLSDISSMDHKDDSLGSSVSLDIEDHPIVTFLSKNLESCLGFVIASERINGYPADKNLLIKCIKMGYYKEDELFPWIMACYKAATSLKEKDMEEKRRYILIYLADILQNPPPEYFSLVECEQYQKIHALTLQHLMRLKTQDIIYGPSEYKEPATTNANDNSCRVIDYAEQLENILENSPVFAEAIPANILWNLYFSKAAYFLSINNYEYAQKNFYRCEELLHSESLKINSSEKIYFLEGIISCLMHSAHFTMANLFLNNLESEIQKNSDHSIEEVFPHFSNYKGICCFSAQSYQSAIDYFNTYKDLQYKKELKAPLSHDDHMQSWSTHLLSALAQYKMNISTQAETEQVITEILSTLNAHPEHRHEAEILTKKVLVPSQDFGEFFNVFPDLKELLYPSNAFTSLKARPY